MFLWPAMTRGAETTFDGCEAADARHLIERSQETTWRSGWHRLQRWRFGHTVSLACDPAACAVSTVLLMSPKPGIDPSPLIPDEHKGSVLPGHERDVLGRTLLKGRLAIDLRRNMADRSYSISANEIRTVWTGYGRLAGLIRIRSRTELTCHVSEPLCTIDDNVIAFIAYDEHHQCGHLSAEETSFLMM